MSKFTNAERQSVKTLVVSLLLKRIPDIEIIEQIQNQTGKSITRQSLYDIRQSVKKDSFQWYKTMREGQYEYIHEFKERINQIASLQKMHNEIIENNKHNPSIVQTSLAELQVA